MACSLETLFRRSGVRRLPMRVASEHAPLPGVRAQYQLSPDADPGWSVGDRFRSGPVQLRSLLQDGSFECFGFCGRAASNVVQQCPKPLDLSQGFHRSSTAIEGQHELPPSALSKWLRLHRIEHFTPRPRRSTESSRYLKSYARCLVWSRRGPASSTFGRRPFCTSTKTLRVSTLTYGSGRISNA
jgi:hypothetical protein